MSTPSDTARRFDIRTHWRIAIMTIVVAAVKADGQVADEEVMRIRSMCARSPIFRTNSVDQDTAIINFADSVTTQLGHDAIVQAAQRLTPELRETAFAFACDMVLADGVVGSSEEGFLEGLVRDLMISPEVGQSIVRVTVIRNRSL